MLQLSEYPEFQQIIRQSPRGIIIFGGSRAGLYTLKVLKHLNINCLCIIDNDIFIEVEGYTYGFEELNIDTEEYNIEVSTFNNFSYYW
jgi:hypothetical protein